MILPEFRWFGVWEMKVFARLGDGNWKQWLVVAFIGVILNKPSSLFSGIALYKP